MLVKGSHVVLSNHRTIQINRYTYTIMHDEFFVSPSARNYSVSNQILMVTCIGKFSGIFPQQYTTGYDSYACSLPCVLVLYTYSGDFHGPLTRYVKLRVAHTPGMPGTFSPPPRVSDPDMHHGTCVTHVP